MKATLQLLLIILLRVSCVLAVIAWVFSQFYFAAAGWKLGARAFSARMDGHQMIMTSNSPGDIDWGILVARPLVHSSPWQLSSEFRYEKRDSSGRPRLWISLPGVGYQIKRNSHLFVIRHWFTVLVTVSANAIFLWWRYRERQTILLVEDTSETPDE